MSQNPIVLSHSAPAPNYQRKNNKSAPLIPVARDAGDSVLAGALSVGLVAGLARGADGMTTAFLARVLVGDFLGLIAIISLLAVVTVAPRRVVMAIETNATRATSC